MEALLKKLNIKMNPNKLLTYIFYGFAFVITLFCFSRMLNFIFGSSRISNDISPYMYTLFILLPPLGFSFYMNSGIGKNDMEKVYMFITTLGLMAVILSSMCATWISNIFWTLIQKVPNYSEVMRLYPELFAPAVRTICLAIPFCGIFFGIDFCLKIFRTDEYLRAIPAFCGLNASSKSKNSTTGPFTCENVICKAKGTSLPVIIPEKKRYEAMLVQGATGTGKTATVLLPMSAFDLEKKFFFREYSKKIGYSILKRGISYMPGPFDNEYVNRNFNLNMLKPKRGKEEEFMDAVSPMVQYMDNSTGEITYRNVGITIVENDGNFISQFKGVADNFDIDVLTIDPASPETTLSINPFAIPDPAKVASIVADVLNSMYESNGGGKSGDPFFTQVTIDAFQNLSILLKEMYPILHDGEIASLEDMLELLYNFDQVEEMTEEMKKIPEFEQKYKLLIKYFEKNFYKPSLNINGYEIPGTRGSGRKDTEKFLYGAITQLNNLVRHPGLKAALCGKKNIVDFDKALRDGSVITACSRKGELGIIQAKAFGMFFILQFQDAVLRRKGNEDSRTPHFIYIDEFPEYINKDMEVMFTLFRKYRCGVSVAIQNLSQLEKSGQSYYKQVVLANTKTQVVFGDTVPEDSAYWEQAFGKELRPDPQSDFKIVNGTLVKNQTTKINEKIRMKGYKIQDQGFGSVYYKTKSANGKSVFGQGNTTFLDSKYKEKADTQMFNFEKFMMNKPDLPAINLVDSDTTTDSDSLFGINTTTKLKQELDKMANESIVDNNSNTKKNFINISDFGEMTSDNSLSNNYEVLFNNEPTTLENAAIDGGAITETYETPTIEFVDDFGKKDNNKKN